MDKVNKVQIRCLNPVCAKWFNSPIMFGDMRSFDTATLIGNKVQCPFCGGKTSCNKENIRISSDDGGFSGKDTN